MVMVPQTCALASAICSRVKPSAVSKSKPGLSSSSCVKPRLVRQNVVADRPAVEDERQLEGARQAGLDSPEHLVGESLRLQAAGIDVRAALQASGPLAVADDVLDLTGRIAQAASAGGIEPLMILK